MLPLALRGLLKVAEAKLQECLIRRGRERVLAVWAAHLDDNVGDEWTLHSDMYRDPGSITVNVRAGERSTSPQQPGNRRLGKRDTSVIQRYQRHLKRYSKEMRTRN